MYVKKCSHFSSLFISRTNTLLLDTHTQQWSTYCVLLRLCLCWGEGGILCLTISRSTLILSFGLRCCEECHIGCLPNTWGEGVSSLASPHDQLIWASWRWGRAWAEAQWELSWLRQWQGNKAVKLVYDVLNTFLFRTFHLPLLFSPSIHLLTTTLTSSFLPPDNDMLQESGIYNGQVVILEVKNDDGTWPRKTKWPNVAWIMHVHALLCIYIRTV